MWQFSNAHHRPSLIIESTSCAVAHAQAFADARQQVRRSCSSTPCRRRRRCRCRRCAMPCAASITAFRPEPHTLLIVSAATWSARPPLSAACRAGFWPVPAGTTLPMMHSSTIAGSMPARRDGLAHRRSRRAAVAVKSFSAPRNLPVGRADGGDDDGFAHGALDDHDDADGRVDPRRRLTSRSDARRRRARRVMRAATASCDLRRPASRADRARRIDRRRQATRSCGAGSRERASSSRRQLGLST